jgi:hypothetical protein
VHRRIDHLVVAVRDLEQAAAFYKNLGFQVGARNVHPWGTENHLIQFDNSFIELIAMGEGAQIEPHADELFSFGAFVEHYLQHREGLAMFVLASDSARSDADRFANDGIGFFHPFFFSRAGQKPDGSPTEVAFTLAFAEDKSAPYAGFFVSQHHFPENFWNSDFQMHPNGAQGIRSVALSSATPDAQAAFLERFTGVEGERPAGHDYTFRLDGSHLDVLTPDDAGEVFGSVEAEMDSPSFVALSIRTPSIDDQAERLDQAAIPYLKIGSRLVVPASVAFGVAIAFEPD